MSSLQVLKAESASPPLRAGTPPALRAAHDTARRTWPGVQLSYEKFFAHVSRGETNPRVPEHASDLYLCAACKDGQMAAYHALEAAYFPALRTILRRLLGESLATEEVLQEVRTRLLVGDPPRIASYRGSGCLASWLRSVAVHAAQDHRRAAGVRRSCLQKLARAERVSIATEATDDQLFQKQRRALCEQAWHSAIRSLDSAERQLLHHHFVSGLTIDALGTIYAVHRATVARRIRRAVAQVRRRIHEVLAVQCRDMSIRDVNTLALRACGDVDVASTLEPAYAARG
jgi:RNA polymerase sigma-70 factor, ECF subfamily